MDLSHSLIEAIESTHVAFQGLSHRLRFVSAEPETPGSSDPTSAVLKVETVHEGQTYRAQCRMGVETLRDAPGVVEALAGAMRVALTGGR